jgi:hypothetical protein
MFVKQRQSNVDIRVSTSQPFFYQISTLKQRRVPGGVGLQEGPVFCIFRVLPRTRHSDWLFAVGLYN